MTDSTTPQDGKAMAPASDGSACPATTDRAAEFCVRARAWRDERGYPTAGEMLDEAVEIIERALQLEWLRLELVPVYNRTYDPNAATVWPRNVQEFVHTGVMPTHCMRDSGD